MKKLTLRISLLTMLCLLFLQSYAQEVTFGIVTDIHYAEIPRSGTRMYSQSLDKLKESLIP